MRTIARAPEWALGNLPIGGHVWVSIGALGQLQRISIPLGAIDDSASVPNAPGALSWDGSRHLYAAQTGATSVATVKLASRTVDGTISIGSAPVSFARDTTYMWVTDSGGHITRVAIATGSISGSTLTVPSSNGVPNRAAWNGGTAGLSFTFVTSNNVDPGVNKLLMLTNSSWPSYSTPSLTGTLPGRVAWDGGSYLYMITARDTITKVSLATGLRVKTITAPATLQYNILWDGATHIYVTASYAILALDLATDTFDTVIPMSGYSVSGLAMDGSGNLYTANYAANPTGSIVKISLATKTIVATLTGFDYPNSIAWDGGSYMWVVQAIATGSVTLVAISTFTKSTTVTLSPTAYVPNEIAWDGGSYMYVTQPYNNRVYRIAIAGGHSQNVIGGFNTNGATQSVEWDGVSHMVFPNNYNGTISTVPTSTGTAIDGTFVTGGSSYGLVRDGSGNLHITNQTGCSLSRYNTGLVASSPVSVGLNPLGMAWDGGTHIYVASSGSPSLSRINVATNSVDLTLTMPGAMNGLAWDHGSYLYVPNGVGATSNVTRVNVATGAIYDQITVGDWPNKVAWDGSNHMYVVNSSSHTVSVINIATGIVDHTETVGSGTLQNVFWDGGSYMWVIDNSNWIYRLRVSDGVSDASTAVGSGPYWMSFDGSGHAYVTNQYSGTVSRILISTGAVDMTITVGASPMGIAWDGGLYVYTCNSGDTTLSRITVSSGAVTTISGLSSSPHQISWDGGDFLYVICASHVSRVRISTSTIDSTVASPGLGYFFAWDGSKNYFASSYSNSTVVKVTSGVVDRTTNIPSNFDGIAWDGGSNMYLCDSALNHVRRVVNTSGSVNKYTKVGSAPKKVAWDGGSYMYVTNSGDGTVSTIAVATGNVDGAPIPVGTSPDEIVWDGADHLYVANQGSNNVSRIKKGAGIRLDGETSLGFALGVLDGSGHIFFVKYGSPSGVGRITVSTGVYDAFIPFIDGATEQGSAIEWAGGQYIYTLSNPYFHYPENIKVYRIDINTLVETVFADLGAATSGSRPGPLQWDGGSYLYTAAQNVVYRIEIATGTVSTLTVGAPVPSYGIASLAWDGGSYMYVGISDTSSGFHPEYVRRFEISSFTLDSTTLSVSGTPVDIAWDHGSYMYVSNYGGYGAIPTDTVSRIRVSDFTLYDSIPLPGDNPTFFAWGGKNLMYLTAQSDPPAVYAIDIATGTVVQALTGFSGYVMSPVWDGSNRLYLSGGAGMCKVAICSGLVDATISVAGIPTGLAWDGPKR